ncbi:MAG: 6-carboxytetrahydropterin synthase [Phycisphaeraceae bacterium]|nr:6-carboxytetrahydropterin synthase [Phycisphaeraceae bacterium]
MFELTVRRTFSAAHAIVMRGVRERLHGHNWGVTLTVGGEVLDPDGLLCDFHALEATLRDVVAAFDNRSLNETAPFDRVNPTAENVAEFIALEVARRLPRGVTVRRVEIEEAPGCVATFTCGVARTGIAVEPKPATAATEPLSATPGSATAPARSRRR